MERPARQSPGLERTAGQQARERQALRPLDDKERLEAKQRGDAAYQEFIEGRRAKDAKLRWSRLHLPDEEVQEAVTEAVAAEERVSVGFAAIADRLLPGHRTQSEAAQLNAALRRLYEQGKIAKHGRGQWGVAPE